MHIEDIEAPELWRLYQRGYECLVRNGVYFRDLVRPAMSHVSFLRAMPLLREYARANHGGGELPPGFGDQMHACPLTPRDLLHLDYAICLGLVQPGRGGAKAQTGPVRHWPGPNGFPGVYVAVDTAIAPAEYGLLDDSEMPEPDSTDEEPDTPFDV